MHKLWCLLAWLLVLGFTVNTKSHAQDYIQIYNNDKTLPLTPHFQYAWEPNSPQSLAQILQQQDRFVATSNASSSFGLSSQGLWFRVNIDNLSETTKLAVNIHSAQLDTVEFYLLDNTEVVAQSIQGKLHNQHISRLPTFTFDAPISETRTLYIRVQSDSSALFVPASIQSIEAHNLSLQRDSVIWGMFYGGLLILVLYNLVLFANTKQFCLLFFIGFVSVLIGWQVIWGGHVDLMIDGTQPDWLASNTDMIIMLVSISAGIFVLTFLDATHKAPKLFYVVILLIVFQLVSAVISTFEVIQPRARHILIYGAGILALISYIAAGVEALFHRFRPAIFYLFGWLSLFAGITISGLTLAGVLPLNSFTVYSLQAALFVQISLFSLALVNKIQHKLRTDVEQANSDLYNNLLVIEEQSARLDIARKDAIKASNIKSQFLANMSHEIRTPLNAILGFGQELGRANLALTENEHVKTINAAAENLLHIVNDVLDFSKIEAGKLKVNNSPFSPLGVFEEMVSIMSKTAHTKGLDFIFDSSPLPEKLISDELRLKQVLTNLIGNALKFTSKGSVSLSVSAHHRQHGVIDLMFDVTDTGIGISRADRKKLFSAFSQVDDTIQRNYQGTGLGLVISQELVRLMNGSIELRSQPGQGSTFSVLVRASHINQRTSFSYPNKVTDISVVVFDPLPESRKATAKMLIALGANVTSVDSLEYLQMIDKDPDFLMIFLPNQSRYSEMTVMHCALTINARNRVVWYCNEDPLQTQPIFKQSFQHSLSMPATPSRLSQLVAVDSMPVLRRTSVTPNTNTRPQNDVILPKLAILAVDDMPMNLALLDTWFKGTAVSLTKAFSAEEAITACHRTEFDIILMDVQMPGIDGLEASKEIRKIAKNIGTPIIAVTAHAFKEEQERLLSNGMDDYLPKPVSYEALMKTLKLWCADVAGEQQEAVNWELALSRSNENEGVSKQMMEEFLRFLPASQKAISIAVKESNYQSLEHEIHKLHGASCYTGAPTIQRLSETIEIHLKRQETDEALTLLPKLYDALLEFEQQSANLLAN